MSSAAPGPVVSGHSLLHDGLIYRTPAEFLAAVLPFLQAGIASGQPILVAVPEASLTVIHEGLNGEAASVEFVDMTRVGRNPARIIPAIHRFLEAHPKQRIRFIGEPIWPGRSDAEILEATRGEAMLNTVFADAQVDIMCPYDAGQLDADVVAAAWRTHPTVIDNAERHLSPHYTDPQHIYADDDPLSPKPPDDIPVIAVQADDLAGVRSFVRHFASDVGLAPRRTQDLVLAVNEIATNTILHTQGSGTLQIWAEPQTVVCEIRDSGYIADAFAGRRQPSDASDHGRGLWMANELCDLVQLRSTAAGTTIRVHVDRLPK